MFELLPGIHFVLERLDEVVLRSVFGLVLVDLVDQLLFTDHFAGEQLFGLRVHSEVGVCEGPLPQKAILDLVLAFEGLQDGKSHDLRYCVVL